MSQVSMNTSTRHFIWILADQIYHYPIREATVVNMSFCNTTWLDANSWHSIL